MTSMTTEQRIQSCYERIQALETTREHLIREKEAPVQNLLDRTTENFVRILAANYLQHLDEQLIQIDNQKKALRNLAEHLQGLLVQHPRPSPASS
jgi:hypothetical protein